MARAELLAFALLTGALAAASLATGERIAPPPPPVPARPAGPALTGRLVRGSAANSLAGRVTLAVAGQPPRTLGTGGRGAFRVEGIPPGAIFDVSLEAPGVLPLRFEGLRFPEDGDLDVGDVPLGAGSTVEFLVTRDAAEPAEGATVALRRLLGPGIAWDLPWWTGNADPVFETRPWAAAEADREGRVSLRGVPPGGWWADVTAPGRSPVARFVAVREGEAREPLRLHLFPSHRLSGIVRTPEGRPAPGVRVEVRPLGVGLREPYPAAWQADSGPEGAYRIEGLPPGPAVVFVEAVPGCRIPAAKVQVPDLEDIDIALEPGTTFRGRVLDEGTGRPVAGARVTVEVSEGTAWGFDPWPAVAGTLSGPDGSFAVPGLPRGRLTRLEVRRAGYAPHAYDWRAAYGGESAPTLEFPQEVRLPRAGAVRGRVADSQGRPLPGALVFAVRRGRGDLPSEVLDSFVAGARTNEDGAFLLGSCPPETVALRVHAPGWWQPGEASGSLGPVLPTVCVPAGGEVAGSVVVRPGVLVEGTARLADGRPAAGFRALLHAKRLPAIAGDEVLIDAEGRFRFEGARPLGRCEVRVQGPDGHRGCSPVLDVLPGVPVRGVSVEVKPGPGIPCVVRRSDGAPAPDARICFPGRVSLWEDIPNIPLLSLREPSVPAADGSCRASLRFEHGGPLLAFARDLAPVLVEGPEEPAHGPSAPRLITLAPGRTIEGRVVDEGGNPVAGAGISLDRHPPPFPSGGFLRQVTGADGRFMLRHVIEGDALVLVRHPRWPAARRSVPPGVAEVEVVLRAGLAIAGTVVDHRGGRGIPAIGVRVAPPGDDRFRRPSLGTPVPDAITDGEGRFRVANLRGGEYLLLVAEPGHDGETPGGYRAETLRRVRAGTEDLRIVLREGRVLAGRVVDERGEPVRCGIDATILTLGLGTHPPPEEGRETRTDERGRFRMTGLPPGEYEIRFSATRGRGAGGPERPIGYASAVVPSAYSGAEDLVVRLSRGFPIAGRVVGEDGNPIPGLGWVRLRPAGSGSKDPGETTLVRGWDDGRFTTVALPPGRPFDVSAEEFDGFLPTTLTGVFPGTKDLVLRLERGESIEGRVLLPDGKAAPSGTPVNATVSGGSRWGRDGSHGSSRTGADGKFRISGLRPGAFVLLAGGNRSGYPVTRAAGTFRAGSAGADVRLESGVTLVGRLVDDAGDPVHVGRLCGRQRGDPDNDLEATVAEDGSFVVRGLRPGKVELRTYRGMLLEEIGEFQAPARDLRIVVRPE